VFDLRHEYAFTPWAAAKVRFCGYIAREPARRTRADVRRELGLGEHEPLLLVTPGGGEDGQALVATCLDSLRAWPEPERPRTHIVCGPEMAPPQREALMRVAAELGRVSTQVFSEDMMSLIGAADVALTMGGYNTVCELLANGRRAVVVPRVVPGQEQLLRAERMAQRGLLTMLHPHEATPHTLLQALRAEFAALAAGKPQRRMTSMQGLEQVSAALRAWLGLAPAPAHQDASAGPLAPLPQGVHMPQGAGLCPQGLPMRLVPPCGPSRLAG
jgi:predicted glycosyltransferase